MAKPRVWDERARFKKTLELLQRLHPEYEPPSSYDPDAEPERALRAKQAELAFKRRAEKENKELLAFAKELIAGVATDQSKQDELAAALASLLPSVRWDWNSRQGIIPDASLPIVGGVQPTPGQMRATLKEGLRHAEALRDWYRALPVALLMHFTVPIGQGQSSGDDPLVGLIIELLTETLARYASQYEAKPGRKPGRRFAAQYSAWWIICFLDRHLRSLSVAKRRDFIFHCLHKLGVDCPNQKDDQGDFNTWFDEAETLATQHSRRQKAALSLAADDSEDRALLKRITFDDLRAPKGSAET